jgi:hypothetical protein
MPVFTVNVIFHYCKYFSIALLISSRYFFEFKSLVANGLVEDVEQPGIDGQSAHRHNRAGGYKGPGAG